MTIKLLFLAANPQETTRLQIDREMRAIDQALRMTTYRDRFELHAHGAVHYSDLQDLLLRYQPHIVHFSGHGSSAGELLLESDSGVHPIPAEALRALFATLKDNIRCVVLNACYSQVQAQAIAAHIDCVIGMASDIDDAAAINFAAAYYRALGYGRSLQAAFDLGCNAIDLANLAAQHIPQLLALHGDPAQVVLIPAAVSTDAEPIAPATGQPPFKGLHFFDVDDVGLFFGREQLTAELVTHLRQHRFLAVVGASGSGKSSVVRAGLVPALQRGEALADGTLPPKGSTHWPIHLMTPKAHPLEQLAATLTQGSESVRAQTTLIDDLAKEPRSLHLYASRLVSPAASDRLLLVVDQFEELFTLCRDLQERRAFVDNLLTAAVDDGVTTVIITLRADFYHRCADFDNLRQALQKDQKYIGPMPDAELRRAIEEPARVGGWELESGLVDLLLDDVNAQSGALPLLSHALLETWKRRRGRTLTLAGYAASGRVQGAIAQTAEVVLHQQLTAEQRPIARNIFVRLTELGEGVQDTRRRVALAELLPQNEEGAAAVETVLKALADARLISTDQHEVEVAHEALIREWQTLRDWLQDDREGLRTHRRLTEAAREWNDHTRDASYLYVGTRLQQAQEWGEGHAATLNDLERDFLTISQQAVDEATRQAEAARQRELDNAHHLAAEAEARQQAETERAQEAEARRHESEQSSRRLRRRAWILAVVALLAVIAAGFAYDRQNRFSGANTKLNESNQQLKGVNETLNQQNVQLEEERARALDLALVSIAGEHLDSNPTTAALILTEIGDPDNTPFAERRFSEVLRLPLIYAELKHESPVAHLLFSPDRNVVVTVTEDNTVRVWDAETGMPLSESLRHDTTVTVALVGPDGKFVLTAAGNLVWLWDVESGEKRLAEPWRHGDPVNTASFSPDGKLVATGGDEGNIWVWDVKTGEERLSEPWKHNAKVSTVLFSPDGKFVLTGDNASARMWDVERGEEKSNFAGDAQLARFSPHGKFVVTTQWDSAHVWNVATAKEEFAPLSHTPSHMLAAWFSPGEELLLTASGHRFFTYWDPRADNMLREWDMQTGELRVARQLRHESEIMAATFSPDGRFLATVSGTRRGSGRMEELYAESTVNMWLLETEGERFSLRLPGGVAAFSPDGKLVLTASGNTAQLWDVETGRAEFPEPLVLAQPVSLVAFSPDGKLVLTASQQAAQLWDVTTGRPHFAEPLSFPELSTVSFSANGQHLTTEHHNGTVQVWDIQTGDKRFPEPPEYCGGVRPAVSPDGKLLVTACGQTVQLWDVETGRERLLPSWSHDSGYVRGLEFSPDGKRVVSASDDRTARIWDVETGRELHRLQHDTFGLYGVSEASFSPDGKRVVTTSDDRTARIWNVETGNELHKLEHLSNVSIATFNADGRFVVTVSAGDQDISRVRVWDAGTGAMRAEIPVNLSTDWSLGSLSKYLVTWQGESARVWHFETGEELFSEPLSHPKLQKMASWMSTGDVHMASISPDGRHLLTTTDDETRVWVISSELLQAAVRSATLVCLSTNFRQSFLGEPYDEARTKYDACERSHGRVPDPTPKSVS